MTKKQAGRKPRRTLFSGRAMMIVAVFGVVVVVVVIALSSMQASQGNALAEQTSLVVEPISSAESPALAITTVFNPTRPPVDARLDLDPILGDPTAPVTIIEYGAYGCEACRAWHQAGIIDQVLNRYPRQVRFIFRDFPVIVPAYDQMAAEVAQCALDQDQALFWALHNALYTTVHVGASRDTVIEAGNAVGLDAQLLRACAESGQHRETVRYDLTRAISLGLPGTPSFLVNDARVFYASPDVLVEFIEQALDNLPS